MSLAENASGFSRNNRHPLVDGNLTDYRVSRTRLCPVCSHPDWCLTDEFNFAICQRVQSDKQWGDAGWYHDLRRGHTRHELHPATYRAALKPKTRFSLVDPEPANAVAQYVYCDERGTVLYRKVRYPVPGGGKITPFNIFRNKAWWTGNKCMEGVERQLYHLPRLIGSTATVYVVEGEKCADLLTDLGYLATCTSEGSSITGWKTKFTEFLRGRDVVILPDHDEPGQKFGKHVADCLYGVAARVRLVNLPGLS